MEDFNVNFIEALQSDDHTLKYQAIQYFRKALHNGKNLNIKINLCYPVAEDIRNKFIGSGLCPVFVNLANDDSHPDIQFEALWVITNIFGGSPQTAYVVDLGIIPILLKLIKKETDEDIEGQAIWALGNIVGDSVEHRDLVIKLGALPLLSAITEARTETMKLTTIENVVRIYYNIVRRHPRPDDNTVVLLLPRLISFLYMTYPTLAIMKNICRAFSFIADGPAHRVQMVIDHGVVQHIAKVFQRFSDLPEVIHPAIRTLGAIALGTEEQTNAIVTSGVMAHFLPFLSSEEELLVKDLCWTISNITAGSESQIQAIIDNGLIPKLVELCFSESESIRKEALWAVVNMTDVADAAGSIAGVCQQAKVLSHSCPPMLLFLVLVSLKKVRELNPLSNDSAYRQAIGYLIRQKIHGEPIRLEWYQ